MRHIAAMVAQGWSVVVSHGNGPQIGYLLRRVELARSELHEVPLDVCGADTQGATGYLFVRELAGELLKQGICSRPVCVITQTVVDPADPAFQAPTKPIGSFMSQELAAQHAAADGWQVIEDSGRGWRRVVASPKPVKVVETDAIRELVRLGHVVIACGGGGIPVTETPDGELHGIEAVIDKDRAAALLGGDIGAELLIIPTAVPKVAVNFRQPSQRDLDRVTLPEAEGYLAAGQFAEGSMKPKIEAALDFLRRGGERVVITTPNLITDALKGRGGTTICVN
jgi:carbamate kinase